MIRTVFPFLASLGVVIAAQAADGAAPTSDTKAAKKYLLRYRFAPGEGIRTKVKHQAAVRTTIEGNSQTAKTVSISVKRWRITDVNDEGHVTFIHSVDYVVMKNDVTGREAVSYDSRSDNEPPSGFEDVAKRVGIPLTRIVMDTSGKVLRREELAAGATTASQLTMPLPKDEISIGDTWTFPDDVVVKLRDGSSRNIKCRQRFELLAVEGNIAKIGVATQILTPIKKYPEIEAQMIQRESDGTIDFDMETGKVVQQVIDLDRQVTGYPNPKSTMHYRTRFTETLLGDEPQTAVRPTDKGSTKN